LKKNDFSSILLGTSFAVRGLQQPRCNAHA